MRSRHDHTRRSTAVARVIRVDEEREREIREYLLVAGAFVSGILFAAGLLV